MSSKQLFFNNHLMTACVAAVFAFGLAACSSSNDQQTTTSTESPTTAAAEKTAITNAIAAAKTAVDGLTAESSDADVAAANAAITAAHTAIAGAEHASAADTVANLAALEAIRTSFATAQMDIEKHRTELAEQRKAAIDAITKSAATRLAAMNDEAAQTTDAGLGGTGAPARGIQGATTLAIDNDGTTVTISVQAGTTADPAADTKYEAVDLGGGQTMHTLEGKADADGDVETQVVIVSHDRKAPKAVAFADFEDAAGTKSQALNVSTNTENDSPDVTHEALAVGQNSDVYELVMSDAFTAATAAELRFPDDDTATADKDEAYEAAGTYNGAKGTYRCNGSADCTVTLNAEGMITAMSAGWVFTPAEDATSDQPDYAYLHYGFWLKKTEDANGVVTYNEVETFADATGLDPSSISTGGAIKGKATYTGGATGVYVRHVYSEGGSKIASSTSGHFSADATLEAHFDQLDAPNNNIPPNLLNTITGDITNFALSGGEAVDWSVKLGGDISDTFGIDNGTAKGGVGDGSLIGQFYGDEDTLPVAATGEFNAGFNNGAVAGAFGVNKKAD